MKIICTRKGEEILVDDEDYEWLNQYTWRIDVSHGYAMTTLPRDSNGRQRHIYMHRLITGLQPGDGLEADHWNRNKADNQRGNLRVCTQLENKKNIGRRKSNTAGYKGVTFDKKTGRWIAQRTCDNKLHFLGRFTSPEIAHEAYKKAALEMHGEFASLS